VTLCRCPPLDVTYTDDAHPEVNDFKSKQASIKISGNKVCQERW